MSSDFCIKCDNALSVYCGQCVDAVRDERDALHKALRETLAALGNGSAATSEASVGFMANTPNEVRAVVEELRRERDGYKANLDAELPAMWREDIESLNQIVERMTRERDEAQANYRFMVERAANEKLDGYRELGARAAAAENERDDALRAVRDLELGIAAQDEVLTRRYNEQLARAEKAEQERDHWEKLWGAEVGHANSWADKSRRAEQERDEARAELAFIESDYAKANEGEMTRDGMALQNAGLKYELRMAEQREAIAKRERDEAVALNQAMSRVLEEHKR